MNIDKCKHLTIGGNSNRQYSLCSNENCIIQLFTEESDLGAIFTNFLIPSIMQYTKHPNDWNHLSYISQANTIYTAFVYTSLVRSHLDYVLCCLATLSPQRYQITGSSSKKSNQIITRYCTPDLLWQIKIINLPSLYYRRLRMDMITFRKAPFPFQ